MSTNPHRVIRPFSLRLIAVSALAFLAAQAAADPIRHVRTLGDVDWTSAGVAGIGAAGDGTIAVGGIAGPVEQAFLYWHGIDNGQDGNYDNADIFLDAVPVTGTAIGTATTNCWNTGNSVAYRADVTNLVVQNGSYQLSGLASQPGHSANGASLVVVYDDGDSSNDRDLAFFEGNDSSHPESFPGEDVGWHATLSPINYQGGVARMQVHMADGQDATDDSLTLETQAGTLTIADNSQLWDGVSLPDAGNSRHPRNGLYDIHDFDISTIFEPRPAPLTMDLDGMDNANDCLGLVLALVELDAGSLPPPPGPTPTPGPTSTPQPTPPPVQGRLELTPGTAQRIPGQQHTVTATVTNGGNPQANVGVLLDISGPNGASNINCSPANCRTDNAGQLRFSFIGTRLGRDLLTAIASIGSQQTRHEATATVDWNFGTPPTPTPPARAATTLDAEPLIARLDNLTPTLILTASAQLTATASGAPLKGKFVEFTAGGERICRDRTDRDGIAACQIVVDLIPVVLDLGFTARFSGDQSHFPSSEVVDALAVESWVEIIDDALPAVSLSASESQISEKGGRSVLTVRLSAPTVADVRVTLAYSGSATRNKDYRSARSVTIPAGDTSAPVTLTARNDSRAELPEIAVVRIESVKNAEGPLVALIGDPLIAAEQAVAILIADDDLSATIGTLGF